jgi:hypothetical protein
MNDIRIERLGLRIRGVCSETIRSALDGLDREIARRLDARAIDCRRLRELSPAVRLPAIDAGTGLDADSLRARIADGLVDWLARGGTGDTEES